MEVKKSWIHPYTVVGRNLNSEESFVEWVEEPTVRDAIRRAAADRGGVEIAAVFLGHQVAIVVDRDCFEIFPVGAKVRLRRAVDRYPHFVAKEGLRGTVSFSDSNELWVHMDEYLDGAEEWGNCVVWTLHDDEVDGIQADLEIEKED